MVNIKWTEENSIFSPFVFYVDDFEIIISGNHFTCENHYSVLFCHAELCLEVIYECQVLGTNQEE